MSSEDEEFMFCNK